MTDLTAVPGNWHGRFIQNMHPYEDHARCLQQLQAEVGAPIGGRPGGFVKFAGTNSIPALVSVFVKQQKLREDGNGLSTFMGGDVILQKSDVPPALELKTGQFLQVTAPGSQARACQIFSVEDKFTFWQVMVQDQNQAA